MASVSQFAQYLLKLDPQRNPARLTLFNFLKHVMEPTLPFSPAVIQAFYARILQFDHWQNDSQNLSDTVRADIMSFIKQTPLEKEAAMWAQIRHPDTLQVVTLKLFQDLADLAESEHAARQKSGENIRLLKLSDNQLMVAVLAPTGNLEVKVYPNLALVWGPRLRLMAPVSHLHYSPALELMPHSRQILAGSLLTTHCFHVDHEGVHGLIVRGYSLQKFETFIRAKMSETQDLFNSLKKLERHFIDPQSDPDYQDMVSRLERANRLLNNPTPDNLATAERALNKGRLYLKNAFPNDRLLGLLITHLDYGISQRQAQRNEGRRIDGPTQ
jgi:hypothetical protein